MNSLKACLGAVAGVVILGGAVSYTVFGSYTSKASTSQNSTPKRALAFEDLPLEIQKIYSL